MSPAEIKRDSQVSDAADDISSTSGRRCAAARRMKLVEMLMPAAAAAGDLSHRQGAKVVDPRGPHPVHRLTR